MQTFVGNGHPLNLHEAPAGCWCVIVIVMVMTHTVMIVVVVVLVARSLHTRLTSCLVHRHKLGAHQRVAGSECMNHRLSECHIEFIERGAQ